MVDALLELWREGNLAPTVAEVASCSGVSHRSVFRYFEDLDELGRAAADRQQQLVAHLYELSDLGRGPLADRIRTLVESRVALFEEVAPTARVARLRAPFVAAIAARLTESRTYLRAQIGQQFAAELAAMAPHQADRAWAGADVLLSFESFELLRHAGRSPGEVGEALEHGLTALLG